MNTCIFYALLDALAPCVTKFKVIKSSSTVNLERPRSVPCVCVRVCVDTGKMDLCSIVYHGMTLVRSYVLIILLR